MELENDKSKEMVIEILQGIIDDMGGLSAKKLMPEMPEEAMEDPEAVKVEIEASADPMEEPEEKTEDMGMLPRWKQRMKKGL